MRGIELSEDDVRVVQTALREWANGDDQSADDHAEVRRQAAVALAVADALAAAAPVGGGGPDDEAIVVIEASGKPTWWGGSPPPGRYRLTPAAAVGGGVEAEPPTPIAAIREFHDGLCEGCLNDQACDIGEWLNWLDEADTVPAPTPAAAPLDEPPADEGSDR